MLAFKLEVSRYGQLTYVRLYQGTLNKGDTIVDATRASVWKADAFVRIHADEMEEMDLRDCRRHRGPFRMTAPPGDTFTDGHVRYAMTSMYVPAPVISLAVKG